MKSLNYLLELIVSYNTRLIHVKHSNHGLNVYYPLSTCVEENNIQFFQMLELRQVDQYLAVFNISKGMRLDCTSVSVISRD